MLQRFFRTVYDKIDVLSEADFISKSGITREIGDHDFMLKRLEFEQLERLQLSKRVRELESERAELKNLADFKRIRINQVIELFQSWTKV